MFGGEDAKLFTGGRFRDSDRASFDKLERRLRSFFPALADVGISHRWGGVVGVTLDMFPSFAAGGSHDNLFHGAGYSGHGVSLANYAGKILAPAVLQRLGIDGPALAPPLPFGRLPFKLPPGPLTYAGMQAYRFVLHAQDRWEKA